MEILKEVKIENTWAASSPLGKWRMIYYPLLKFKDEKVEHNSPLEEIVMSLIFLGTAASQRYFKKGKVDELFCNEILEEVKNIFENLKEGLEL